jgi:hypothetical protein
VKVITRVLTVNRACLYTVERGSGPLVLQLQGGAGDAGTAGPRSGGQRRPAVSIETHGEHAHAPLASREQLPTGSGGAGENVDAHQHGWRVER